MSRISIRPVSGGLSQTTPVKCVRVRTRLPRWRAAAGVRGQPLPVPRERYRLGLPAAGPSIETLNTDSSRYGGSNIANRDGIEAEPIPWHGQEPRPR